VRLLTIDVYTGISGNAYLDVGKVQEALNSFQQVALLDPDHADAYFNMAIIHQEHAADESIGTYICCYCR
jgi:hypothetical protein